MTTKSRTAHAGGLVLPTDLGSQVDWLCRHGKPWLCRQQARKHRYPRESDSPCWRRRAMQTRGVQLTRNGCSVGVSGSSARLLRARLDTAQPPQTRGTMVNDRKDCRQSSC